MSQVINTNSLSLLTQNNLNKSQSALNTAIERLSSGMRINSAKDDAAGQAIANRFTANIKGLTQATRNANDGISIAQTTEGALTEVNNNLQRIRELSVQAANGTNSQSDLDSIQDEIGQRLDEINRVSDQTQFNGVKVLSAEAGKLTVQVGANDGETIDIDLKEISAETLGLTGFNVNGGVGEANTLATAATAATAAGASDLTALGYTTTGVADADGVTTYTLESSGQVITNAAAGASDVLGKVVTNGVVTVDGAAFTKQADGSFHGAATAAQNDAAVQAKLLPASGSTISAKITIGGTAQDVVIDDAGNMTDGAGNQVYMDTLGNLTMTQAAGTEVAATLSGVISTTSAGSAAATIEVTGGATAETFTLNAGAWDSVQSFSAADIAAKVGAAATSVAVDTNGSGTAATSYAVSVADGSVTNAGGAVYVEGANLSNNATTTQAEYANVSVAADGTVTNSDGAKLYVDGSGNLGTGQYVDGDGNLGTGKYMDADGNLGDKKYLDKDGAFTDEEFAKLAASTDPLKKLDAALSQVDKLRSSLGAVQNRFDSAIANLGTTITNLSSSRSRIEDADYAVEVSNMTRAQILQQAGTSVLAQANQTTQGVLSLLR